MPLGGIGVLPLTRRAPGPFCTMLLGDLGADVIVVEEAPGAGRRFDVGMGERAQAYNPVGRNKRSLGLNLKDERAREVFYRLADGADVVLEGFRPGVVKRLGVDYETVSAINPRIVYCSLSGYGQTGPYASLVGHDINYISIGGALGINGWPGQPPAIPANIIADFAGGGLYAAFAILAAVIAREKTGRGQYVDMAMSDGVTSLATFLASMYFNSGHVLARGVVAELEHPEFGTVRQVGVGPKFSDTPGAVRTTAPQRGEHTDEVLREAGYSEDEIRALKEAKAAG